MEDYKEITIIEQKELKEKFLKLVKFINSEEFFKLSSNNKQILKNQKIVMELYLSILNMRIYEDIDKISIPDLGFMQMIGNVFGNNWNKPFTQVPDNFKTVEQVENSSTQETINQKVIDNSNEV